jgi:hypothetical protein
MHRQQRTFWQLPLRWDVVMHCVHIVFELQTTHMQSTTVAHSLLVSEVLGRFICVGRSTVGFSLRHDVRILSTMCICTTWGMMDIVSTQRGYLPVPTCPSLFPFSCQNL